MSTAVVLGAGASADFGLPIGSKLRQQIISGKQALIDQLCHQSDRNDSFHRDNMYTPYVRAFTNAFSSSGATSIDRFVLDRSDYRDIGRTAIALNILPHELSVIRQSDSTSGCYHLLYDYFRSDANLLNSLRVVSFNYDRVFEHLYAAMIASRNPETRPDTALDVISNRVCHVYGSFHLKLEFNKELQRFVNDPSWQPGDGLQPRVIQEAAANILTIGDKRSDQVRKRLPNYPECFRDADWILFLGFGFDKDNLNEIGLDAKLFSDGRRRNILATARGLPQRIKDETKARIPGIQFFDESCTDLMMRWSP